MNDNIMMTKKEVKQILGTHHGLVDDMYFGNKTHALISMADVLSIVAGNCQHLSQEDRDDIRERFKLAIEYFEDQQYVSSIEGVPHMTLKEFIDSGGYEWVPMTDIKPDIVSAEVMANLLLEYSPVPYDSMEL